MGFGAYWTFRPEGYLRSSPYPPLRTHSHLPVPLAYSLRNRNPLFC